MGRNAVDWDFSFPCSLPTSAVLDHLCLISPLVCSPLCVILSLALRNCLPNKHGTALSFPFEVGRVQGGLDPGPDPIPTGRRMAESQVKPLGRLGGLSVCLLQAGQGGSCWSAVTQEPLYKAIRTKNATTNKTRWNIKLKSVGDHHGSNVILNVIMQPLCEGMTLRDLLAQQLHCVYPGVQKVMEWTSFSHNF